MALTYGDVGNAFKIFYADDLIEGFYTQHEMLSRWEKTSEDIVGKYAMFAMETIGYHGGVQAGTSETAAFPLSGTPEVINPYVTLKRLDATATISTEAIKRSTNKAGAWAKQLERLKLGILRDYKWDCSRQLYGDGQGKLAYLTGTDTTTPAPVDDGVYGTKHHYCKPGIYFWHVAGTTHDAYTAGWTADKATDRYFTAATTGSQVAWSGGVIVTPADGDYLIKKNATNASDSGVASEWYEMQGMRTHVDTAAPTSEGGTNYQNVARASYTALQGQVQFNPAESAEGTSTRALTFEVMIQALNAGYAVGANVTAGYMNYPIERELAKMEAANKRYGDTVTFKGGVRAVMWEGVPFFVNRDCTRNMIYMVDESTFRVYQLGPPEPWDGDGSIFRGVYTATGTNFTPQIQINYIWWANSACVAPFKNVRLTDLEESTTDPVTAFAA